MLKITFLTLYIFCNSTLGGTAFQFWGLAHENHHIHFFLQIECDLIENKAQNQLRVSFIFFPLYLFSVKIGLKS